MFASVLVRPGASELEQALATVLSSHVAPVIELVPGQHHIAAPADPVARLERLALRLATDPEAADELNEGLRELEAGLDLSPESLAGVLRLRIRLRRHHEAAEASVLARLTGAGAGAGVEGSGSGGDGVDADLLAGEVGALYRISARSATRRLHAVEAAQRLPRLRALHAAGEVDQLHVRVVAEATARLRSDAHAAAVDAAVAAKAPRLSVGEIRLLAERAVLEADPEAADRAARAVRRSADVQVLPHDGGTGADLIATGPLGDIAELMAAVETRAGLCRHARQTGAAGRARFDALLALVRGGLDKTLACPTCGQVITDLERGSRRRRARTRVLVTVPHQVLTGQADLPGALDRYGPISASEARRIACQEGSTLQRLIYEARTGIATDLDPQRYRLTAAEADLLAARDDGTCTAPGCPRPATTCQADHRLDYGAGGPTSWPNLQSLCDHDHNSKTQHAWTAEPNTTGGTTWTSPLGQTHQTDPVDHRPLLRPNVPDDPDPPF